MGGGDFPIQQQTIKKSYVEVPNGVKTDSFIKIVSDIPPWGIWLGVFCLFIGFTVVLILAAKLTPLGQLLTKGFNGLKAMFKALIAWNPKGKKK